MLTNSELQTDLDNCAAFLHRHCTIGDVMQACGQMLAEAQPWSIAGVAHADTCIRNMARKHGKPAHVTAVLVLTELTRILDDWCKRGLRIP